MYLKGHRVPALENKPEVPSYLQIVLIIHRDLLHDGTIRYADYALWCDRNGIKGEQFNYLWEVLFNALLKVGEWQKKESSPKKSEKPTSVT